MIKEIIIRFEANYQITKEKEIEEDNEIYDIIWTKENIIELENDVNS